MSNLPPIVKKHWRLLWLLAALALYGGLASYQLGLPGLHYDEAAEAGVNAMEIITGASSLTAFRGATFPFFGRPLPLMVQDYIGALNVYLALPFLAFTGIGVPNLRMLPILTGLAALLLVERAVSAWQLMIADCRLRIASNVAHPNHQSFSLAGLITVTLLATAPSFVFWSRQGIFVTNLTQPLCFWCIWQGLHWLRTGRERHLITSAFAAGLALYAKLLAIWLIGPFALLLAGWWFWRRRARQPQTPALSLRLLLLVFLAFTLPLLPCLLFNWQTGGTLQRLVSNLDQSYYGVDNRALLQNLLVRSRQLVQTLRGDHLWYLSGLYANRAAPWLAAGVLLLALLRGWRSVTPPLLLLLLAVTASLFTVSDLFITHYALLHPLAVAVVGISLATLVKRPGSECEMRNAECGVKGEDSVFPIPHSALRIFILIWLLCDLNATLRYHGALSRSGGLADHSDASYHLAYHLRYNGLGAPLALDWGFAAPVRYLSEGTVTPIEIFGYASLEQPDAQFEERLGPFLANPDNVYLLHAPGATVFAGRREAWLELCARLGLQPVLEQRFTQRDGAPLYELWRVAR